MEAARPPESGGQHDRDAVEIVRGEVPRPQHLYKVCLGTSPPAPLSRRAALLTQEGVPRLATNPLRTRVLAHIGIEFVTARKGAGLRKLKSLSDFILHVVADVFPHFRIEERTDTGYLVA